MDVYGVSRMHCLNSTDLEASLNGLSRDLEVSERRSMSVDLRFVFIEIRLSLRILKSKKKCH